jgi:CHAT domain-containing protein
VLGNLADALTASGEYEAARPFYERELRITSAIFGAEHIRVASNFSALATNFALSGQSEKAEEMAVRSEDLTRTYEQTVVRTMPEREALLFAASQSVNHWASGMVTLLSLAAAGGPAAQAFDAVIRSRSVVFDEIAARRSALDAGCPELARLTAARKDLAGLVVNGPRSTPRAPYEAKLVRAREEKYEAERAVAARSAHVRREIDGRNTGLSGIREVLGKDSALISFVLYQHRELRLHSPAAHTASPPVASYLALVLLPEQPQPTAFYLGPAKQVDALIAEVRKRVAQEARNPGLAPAYSEAAYRRSAANLRKIVWDPFAPLLQGADRIFIVPDGALHLVNFAALPVGRSGYLVENRPLLHYLSAERDLATAQAGARGRGLLAIGNPNFGPRESSQAAAPLRSAPSNCGDYRSLGFETLPGTASEVKEVLAVWRQSHQAGPAIELSGGSARWSLFEASTEGKRILHLATHGFFLGACQIADSSAGYNSGAAENPLLLSGLALSGANRARGAKAARENGIVTAEEIAAMNLEGVEWVVLSACDTGLGLLQSGEGVFGLRRAFQTAGAATVIASLWPVEDASARTWMRTLYQSRLADGMTTAESVRKASLAVLTQRRAGGLSTHPLYWGSFVAVGDWR